jgi:hypothetical protein
MMGIGRDKRGCFDLIEVPLISSGITYPASITEKAGWEDNTWIVEQLRHLANIIEEENPNILSIGLQLTVNEHLPELVIMHIGNK